MVTSVYTSLEESTLLIVFPLMKMIFPFYLIFHVPTHIKIILPLKLHFLLSGFPSLIVQVQLMLA